MENRIYFSKDQLKFLGAIIRKNSPEIDPNDDATFYTRQGHKDAAALIESLSDPENMRRATAPGKISE